MPIPDLPSDRGSAEPERAANRSRRDIVDLLVDRFDAVRLDERPRLVALEAPMGWGKTYLVRELYHRLATERQSRPGYWPETMASQSGSWSDDRKLVFPRSFDIPDGAAMDWFWWGLSCQVEQWGGLLDAFASPTAVAQFQLHLGHMLTRIESRRRTARIGLEMAQIVASLLPLPDIISMATSLKDLGKQSKAMFTEARRLREASEAPSTRIDVGAGFSSQTIDQLGRALALLSRPELPIVLVIDDAHWAHSATLQMLEEALRTKGSLLVVATLWPASHRGDSPFGAWVREGAAREPGAFDLIELDRLSKQDLEDLVLESAPNSDPAIVSKFASCADGNPLVLKGYLEISAVKDALVDGRYDLEPMDPVFDDLPRSVEALYSRLWDELPDDVQKLLSLATVGGMQFVTDWLVQVSREVLALDAPGEPATAEAVRTGWVNAIDDALSSFGERSRYLAALDAAPEELGRRRFVAAERLIEYTQSIKSGGTWEALPPMVREVLLEGHLIAARTGLQPVDDRAVEAGRELAELAGTRNDPARAVAVARPRPAGWWESRTWSSMCSALDGGLI